MNIQSEIMGTPEKIGASKLNTQERLCLKPIIMAGLALWFGLVLLLGARGAFAGAPGTPPLPIFFGFAIPLALFFAAYLGWPAFRTFVLSADLRLISAIQGWRWAGIGFLSLYAHDILPALFAFPAGLGDMAVGFAAPWIVVGLIRQPSFATSRRFVLWNILGITDLIVAVSLGTICSGFLPGLTGSITTSPMSHLPLVIVPAFLVPLFIMLHLTALFQVRQFSRSPKSASAQTI